MSIASNPIVYKSPEFNAIGFISDIMCEIDPDKIMLFVSLLRIYIADKIIPENLEEIVDESIYEMISDYL